MKILSTAFPHDGPIPPRYTCDGKDVSPPLEWSGVPAGAKSLALVVEDPDAPDPAAPTMTWAHWVLYNIPPGYGGPCPPVGRHRYFHRLYALDAALPDLRRPTRARLAAAMQGHVIDEAALVGTYQKRR